MCATDRPFARGFARGLEELVVTVPCTALRGRADISRLSKPAMTSFAADGGTGASSPGPLASAWPYARALARLTGRATGPASAPPPDEGTVLDLVAVLTAGRDAALGTAHRAAARCYIEEHLTSQGLGAEQIAAATGISERQLSRVFAADGTSVPRHVLTRRLQLAYSMLAAEPGAEPGGGEPWPTSPPAAASRRRPTSRTCSAWTSASARAMSAASTEIVDHWERQRARNDPLSSRSAPQPSYFRHASP